MSDADLRYQHLRGDITDPRHGRQRRDGVLLEHIGGRGLANLDPTPGSVGKCVDLVWPDQVAALVTQLTRRAIANRTAIDAQFRDSGVAYQVRVTAHGPDRAICVIRPAAVAGEENVAASTAELPTQQLDRRGFLRRFKDCLSSAGLRETPTAVAIVHVDRVADISRIIDTNMSEQISGWRNSLPRRNPSPTSRWHRWRLRVGLRTHRTRSMPKRLP